MVPNALFETNAIIAGRIKIIANRQRCVIPHDRFLGLGVKQANATPSATTAKLLHAAAA